MRFLVDAQISPALARWITEHGVIAEHVKDLDLASAEDHEIWSYAVLVNAIIITKDQDFAVRRAFSQSGPPIVWIRVGNSSRRELIAWFADMYPSIITALDQGEILIEII